MRDFLCVYVCACVCKKKLYIYDCKFIVEIHVLIMSINGLPDVKLHLVVMNIGICFPDQMVYFIQVRGKEAEYVKKKKKKSIYNKGCALSRPYRWDPLDMSLPRVEPLEGVE